MVLQTIEMLENEIKHLITQRNGSHGYIEWQNALNNRLTYLYNLKYKLLKRIAAEKAVYNAWSVI